MTTGPGRLIVKKSVQGKKCCMKLLPFKESKNKLKTVNLCNENIAFSCELSDQQSERNRRCV